MAPQKKLHRITIANVKKTINGSDNDTVLHTALMAGIDFPYACASGNCGSCICRLDSGKVSLLPRGDASLLPEQIKAGQTLACRARPRGDVTVTWLGRGRK
ncbi:MAG: 2Fe-2S iron-sulfur cluster binding domain-containing protein [Acetobacteraceae bacterium]|nr:2Fe-2S iron-sulfur cluster binding domain-containing protein [Acetobacteraceae bacterium]